MPVRSESGWSCEPCTSVIRQLRLVPLSVPSSGSLALPRSSIVCPARYVESWTGAVMLTLGALLPGVIVTEALFDCVPSLTVSRAV